MFAFLACDKEGDNTNQNCNPVEWNSNIHNDFTEGYLDGNNILLKYEDVNTPDSICTKHSQLVTISVKSKNGLYLGLNIYATATWGNSNTSLRLSHTIGGVYEGILNSTTGLDMGPAFSYGIGKINIFLQFEFTNVDAAISVDMMKELIETDFQEMHINIFYTKCNNCEITQTPVTDYTDIVPSHQAARFNLSADGKRIVVWDTKIDSFYVYNTDDGKIISAIFHPGLDFDNLLLTPDGNEVIFNTYGNTIRVYNASNGIFTKNIDVIAYLWTLMDNGKSIIGFSDYIGGVPLITKEGSRLISVATGKKLAEDNYPEINSPFIVGGRGDKEYVMVNYPIDLNNPFSPTTKPVLRLRDIYAKSYLLNESINIQAFKGYQFLSPDGKAIGFVELDNSKKYISFYDFSSKPAFLNRQEITSNVFYSVAMGPDDIAVYPESGKLSVYDYRSGKYSSAVYSIKEPISNDFYNTDISDDGKRVAAAYIDGKGKIHIIIWKK